MAESHAGPRTTCCIDGYTNEARNLYVCSDHRASRPDDCCYPCTEQNKPPVDCMFCLRQAGSTHWAGCWAHHPVCASAILTKIQTLVANDPQIPLPAEDTLAAIHDLLK